MALHKTNLSPLFSEDVNNIASNSRVISGYDITVSGNDITITAGRLVWNDSKHNHSETNFTIPLASTGKHRYDLIYFNPTTTNIERIDGVEVDLSQLPVSPDVNGLVLYRLYVTESNIEVEDLRVDIVRRADDLIVNNLTVEGDLVVNGTTTTVNTTDLDVSDNIIRLNAGETGTGVTLQYSGIQVDRGTIEQDAVLVWDEGDQLWKIGFYNKNTDSFENLSPISTSFSIQTIGEYKEDITVPSSSPYEVTIIHNLDTDRPVVEVYDSSNNLVQAEVEVVDFNTIKLIFDASAADQTFKVVVQGGRVSYTQQYLHGTLKYNETITVPSSSPYEVTITHGLNDTSPMVSVYDSGYNKVNVDTKIIDTDTIKLTFSESEAGQTFYVAVEGGKWVNPAANSPFDASLLPTSDNVYNVGSATQRWKDGHFSGNVNVGVSILPYDDNVVDIGSSTKRFKDGYFAGNVYVGDIVFQNKWKITEYDENKNKLPYLRVLDESGNEVFVIYNSFILRSLFKLEMGVRRLINLMKKVFKR